MLLDERNEFADATALNTGGAGTYLIGDQIDLSVARDVGNGCCVFLVITVDTLPTSATSAATAQFTLASDASAAVATDGSASVHYQTKAFAISGMAAGTVLAAVALPIEGVAYERYLGLLQTTAGEAFTGGKVNAFLTTDVSRWKAYDAPSQL